MRLLPRSLCAPGRRSRRFSRPGLEALEIRAVPAAITAVPDAASERGAPDPLVQPTFRIDPTPGGISSGEGPYAASGTFGEASPQGYSPAQIRGAYGIDSITFGSLRGTGAGQTIAIVDAYDDPALVDSTSSDFRSSDLARFDAQFGLPDPPSFLKLNQNGGSTNLPGTDPAGAGNAQGNWEVEEALDVEWAHAIAPAANIVLIECSDDSGSSLYAGVAAAVAYSNVSVVSLSWGSAEFNGEQTFDSEFSRAGVTIVASTGDDGSPGEYPASSPNVLAVGGTNLSIGPDNTYGGETAWSGSGGGVSAFEWEPAYQYGAQSTGRRVIPDVGFDAAPGTAVPVYDSYNDTSGRGPWEEIGGTSLSAPCWAGLIAIADQGRVAAGGTPLTGPTQTLPALYSLPPSDFHDVTSGGNGGFNAQVGYDAVTGLGTPVANLLVPALAASTATVGNFHLAMITQPPSVVTAGAPFALTVAFENGDGTVQSSFNGSVTISLANDPGGVLGAILGGALTVTAHDGLATFSGLSLARAGGGYAIMAGASEATPATTRGMTVTPAAAAQLLVIAQPPAYAGVNVRFGLTVAVEDRFGNIVPTASNSVVTIELAADPGGTVLGGTLSANLNQGVATFSGLTLKKIDKGYAIIASTPGLTSVQTVPFNVMNAAMAKVLMAERRQLQRIEARRKARQAARRTRRIAANPGAIGQSDAYSHATPGHGQDPRDGRTARRSPGVGQGYLG